MTRHVILVVVVFCAQFLATITGFGASMIMEPVLFVVLTETASLLIAAIVHCATGLYRAFLFRADIDWKLAASFGIPAACAAIAGAITLVELPLSLFGHLLGIFLIAYVLFSYLHPQFVIPNNTTTNLVGGVASGFLAGLFGIRGALQATFLTAYRLENRTYIATNAVISLTTDFARLCVYVLGGMRLSSEVAHHVLLYVVAGLVGVRVAHALISYTSQVYLRFIITSALLIVGFLLAGGFYELIAS